MRKASPPSWSALLSVVLLRPSTSNPQPQQGQCQNCRGFLQETVRAWRATLVSRLLLCTGQELILRCSYMLSSLEHLHSCKSRKILVKVMPVIPPLSSTPFSSLHFILSILKELHLRHIRWCPSLCNRKESSTTGINSPCGWVLSEFRKKVS